MMLVPSVLSGLTSCSVHQPCSVCGVWRSCRRSLLHHGVHLSSGCYQGYPKLTSTHNDYTLLTCPEDVATVLD